MCIGNHERDHPGQAIPYPTIDSGGECGVPYAARFPMPTPADAASAPADQPWYSYDHGPVHFTVMSTEHHFGEGSAQHRWLESDLAGVDRSRTPWLVLVGHRPVYIDADEFGEQGKGTTAIQVRLAWMVSCPAGLLLGYCWEPPGWPGCHEPAALSPTLMPTSFAGCVAPLLCFAAAAPDRAGAPAGQVRSGCRAVGAPSQVGGRGGRGPSLLLLTG